MKCEVCGSNDVIVRSVKHRKRDDRKVRTFLCKSCGHEFKDAPAMRRNKA